MQIINFTQTLIVALLATAQAAPVSRVSIKKMKDCMTNTSQLVESGSSLVARHHKGAGGAAGNAQNKGQGAAGGIAALFGGAKVSLPFQRIVIVDVVY